MKQITFYLDFISPYAYLAFEHLPVALMGHSYCVTYKPILFAVLLKRHGQLGPAEIVAKRDWTYRQVQWLAHRQGIELQLPASHPFNPLALLRLAVACEAQGQPNRYVCETIFRHVWQDGQEAVDVTRLQTLRNLLAPQRDPAGEAVKAELAAHTAQAIEHGVFGVPTFAVDGKLFWGLDALPMLRDYLAADVWFAQGHWEGASTVGAGVVRLRS